MKSSLQPHFRTVLCRQCQHAPPPQLSFVSFRQVNTFARSRRRYKKQILAERERLYDEKTQREMAEIKTQHLEPYSATDWETLPKQNYSPQQSGQETLPFVKPLNEPYPNAPFNEVSPEPLLIWNDFQERYELRDKRILSEKTKQILLSMHRRFPTVWTREQISRNFGLSSETVDFIFWEHEMRSKYKIPYDLDTIKLLEAYCGTDDIIESKAHTMMAYSDVTGDPFYSIGKFATASPLVVPEEELDTQLYSWQRKQKFVPDVRKDQFEMVPTGGVGSGKVIESEDSLMRDEASSYLIVDISDERMESKRFEDNKNESGVESLTVKVRECNGTMRWATVEELNYAREKEYGRDGTPYGRVMKLKSMKGARGGFGADSKRLFPRKPYIDRHNIEHHWRYGSKDIPSSLRGRVKSKERHHTITPWKQFT